VPDRPPGAHPPDRGSHPSGVTVRAAIMPGIDLDTGGSPKRANSDRSDSEPSGAMANDVIRWPNDSFTTSRRSSVITMPLGTNRSRAATCVPPAGSIRYRTPGSTGPPVASKPNAPT
jgi:hypothetical protein